MAATGGRLERFLKRGVGLALLPVCVSLTRTLVALVAELKPASAAAVPASAWGLLIGFGFWIVLFFTLPRPMRTYVLGHELTHALWALVFGARIGRMKVGARGGHVMVSKTNAAITLAPYFFPLYTFLVMGVYGGLSLFYDLHTYEPFWLGCIGLTWAFHLTFTLSMLSLRQPDIQEQGALFSYTVIYALNVLGLCLWLVAVARPTLAEFGAQATRDAWDVARWLIETPRAWLQRFPPAS